MGGYTSAMSETTDTPSPVDRYLKRRAILRRYGLGLLMLIALSAVAANIWAYLRGGDDWSRFDQRHFVVQSVLSGDRMAIESVDGRVSQIVTLLGIDAPDLGPGGMPHGPGALEAYQSLREMAQGKRVMLGLPGLGTRSADGTLLAYVYRDGDPPALSLNERLVADGLAFADRRLNHPFHKQFNEAEGEARRKRRGMWAFVRDDQQPEWRRQWLKSMGADTQPSD